MRVGVPRLLDTILNRCGHSSLTASLLGVEWSGDACERLFFDLCLYAGDTVEQALTNAASHTFGASHPAAKVPHSGGTGAQQLFKHGAKSMLDLNAPHLIMVVI